MTLRGPEQQPVAVVPYLGARTSGAPACRFLKQALMNDRTDTPDRVLSARLKASDSDAFKVVFYRYYEPLYGFVARRVPAGEMPQDVVQDVFARLWQNRAGIDPDQPLKAYLFRIANNILIDQYRKREVRQAYAARQPDATPAVAPAEHFDVEEQVMDAIAQLPEVVRQTFILNRFEALTYREIADLLGISIKTVESRMSKALRQLRALLQHTLMGVF